MTANFRPDEVHSFPCESTFEAGVCQPEITIKFGVGKVNRFSKSTADDLEALAWNAASVRIVEQNGLKKSLTQFALSGPILRGSWIIDTPKGTEICFAP